MDDDEMREVWIICLEYIKGLKKETLEYRITRLFLELSLTVILSNSEKGCIIIVIRNKSNNWTQDVAKLKERSCYWRHNLCPRFQS